MSENSEIEVRIHWTSLNRDGMQRLSQPMKLPNLISLGKPRRQADIQRRTFLKGVGVALLLPRLESLGQVACAESPRRLLTIVNHLSFYQPELIPQTDGVFGTPPPLLAELSDHLKQLKIFSGLDNPAVQNGFGHTPCVGILSGYFNKLHRKNRLSIDQAVADLIGDDTRFKSLVFQAGKNLNFSQISWDKHGLPVHQIDSPRKIFNLLFQVDESEKTQRQVLAEDRTILDAVSSQAKSMEKHLNATDRANVFYYDALRAEPVNQLPLLPTLGLRVEVE